MRTNEDDEQPDNSLSGLLKSKEKDPASIYYQRELVYPKLRWWVILLNVFGFLAVLTALTVLLWYLVDNRLVTILVPIGVGVLYLCIRLKSIMIFCVECYQLLAPTKTRMNCRFEPSCSQYMILSIKKYGAIRGFIKGVKRLKRCVPPNGGYDEP